LIWLSNKFVNVIRAHFHTVEIAFVTVEIHVQTFCHIIIAGQSAETVQFLHTYPANDGWLSIITIRERQFIKINRHKSINVIIDAIQRALEK
jgi:hypothetical protein